MGAREISVCNKPRIVGSISAEVELLFTLFRLKKFLLARAAYRSIALALSCVNVPQSGGGKGKREREAGKRSGKGKWERETVALDNQRTEGKKKTGDGRRGGGATAKLRGNSRQFRTTSRAPCCYVDRRTDAEARVSWEGARPREGPDCSLKRQVAQGRGEAASHRPRN
jgi:hypothetical protein